MVSSRDCFRLSAVGGFYPVEAAVVAASLADPQAAVMSHEIVYDTHVPRPVGDPLGIDSCRGRGCCRGSFGTIRHGFL